VIEHLQWAGQCPGITGSEAGKKPEPFYHGFWYLNFSTKETWWYTASYRYTNTSHVLSKENEAKK